MKILCILGLHDWVDCLRENNDKGVFEHQKCFRCGKKRKFKICHKYGHVVWRRIK